MAGPNRTDRVRRALRTVAVTVLFFILVVAGARTALSSPGESGRGSPGTTTNPPSLTLLGQVGGTSNAFALQGNYAYVGVGPRLVVVNVTNPALPVVVGKTAILPGVVQCITIVGR